LHCNRKQTTDSNKLLLIMPRSCLVLYFIYKKRDILHTCTIYSVTFKRLVVSCIATTKIGDTPFRVHYTPPYKKNIVYPGRLVYTDRTCATNNENVFIFVQCFMSSTYITWYCFILWEIWNLFWHLLQYWFIKYLKLEIIKIDCESNKYRYLILK
jgi:hypothetical protein